MPAAPPPGPHITFRNPGHMCAGIAVIQVLWASPAGQAALEASPALQPETEAMGRSQRRIDPSPLWAALGLEHWDQSAEEIPQLLCQRLPAVAAALSLELEEVTLCAGCPHRPQAGVPAFMVHASAFREENPRVPGSPQDALEHGRPHFSSPYPSCGERRAQSSRIGRPTAVLAVSVCLAVHSAGHPAGSLWPWALDTKQNLTVGDIEYELTAVVLHTGRTGSISSTGHYATAVVSGGGAALCDDSSVSSIRLEDTTRYSAVALYDRRRPTRLARVDRGAGRRRTGQRAAPRPTAAIAPAPASGPVPKGPSAPPPRAGPGAPAVGNSGERARPPAQWPSSEFAQAVPDAPVKPAGAGQEAGHTHAATEWPAPEAARTACGYLEEMLTLLGSVPEDQLPPGHAAEPSCNSASAAAAAAPSADADTAATSDRLPRAELPGPPTTCRRTHPPA